LGFALHALGASFRPGIEVVLECLDFQQQAAQADLVITGEGRIDGQTLYGKTIMGVLDCCQKVQTPVILLAGAVELEAATNLLFSDLSQKGAMAVLDSVPCLFEATEISRRAVRYLEWSAEQTGRLLRLGGSLCGS
jgi:glycerate 2-kinase